MIYKKYELSLSLNGDEIVHIARNSAGNVIFRESSESKLKKAIEAAIKEQEYQEELAEQKKLEKESKKAKRNEVVIEEEKVVEEETITTEPTEVLNLQKRVTRGPDGKFISKNQLDLEEEDKKKSFWNKLTS